MQLFMTNKLDRFLDRTYFPETRDLLFEEKKLNLARILIGLVILWRTAKVALAANFYFPADTSLQGINFSSEVVFALFECTLALLLTVGACTPLTLLGIIITYPLFDRALSISTLGTNVMIFFLVGLLMLNARSRFSFDSWAEKLKETNPLRRTIERLYCVLGMPDSNRIRRIYFLCFLCYAAISFGAMLHHINDPHWISGHTIAVLLTNSYLCPHYEFFQSVQASWPTAFFLFSASGIIAQTFYQIAMVPCLFSRWGTAFVVLQGLAFFLISAICISLSYLPFVELVLWGVIFWSSSLHSFFVTRILRNPLPAKQLELSQTPKHAFYIHETYLRLSAICLLLFVANFPILENYTSSLKLTKHRVKNGLKRLGLEIPNVFNKTDLAMGNRWTAIFRNADGERTLIPFHNTDGARLWYLKSDILYYGNSLAWRRRCIGMSADEMLDADSNTVDLMKRAVVFDSQLHPFEGQTTYEIFIFENTANNVSLPLAERYARENVGKMTFTRESVEADWDYAASYAPNSQQKSAIAKSPNITTEQR